MPTVTFLRRTYQEAFSGLPPAAWRLSGVLFVHRLGFMVMPFLPLYLTGRRSMTLDSEVDTVRSGSGPWSDGRFLAVIAVSFSRFSSSKVCHVAKVSV